MKAKITDVRIIDKTNSSFDVQILNDKDEVIYETTRGFTSTTTDQSKFETELKLSLENIKNQYVNETSSIASDSLSAKIGETIVLAVEDQAKEAAVQASAVPISIKEVKESLKKRGVPVRMI